MKRVLNLLSVCLFLLGYLAIPAVHGAALQHERAACASSGSDDHHAPVPHDTSQCGICQMAHAPLLVAVPVLTVVPVSISIASTPAPNLMLVARPIHLLPFSCGPPA